jgi:3',5'-cyclic AMP phosphodiesterase CpdA
MTFLLAHLSDPHVPPLPVARMRDLAGKRMLGYLNWTRNRRGKHRRDLLDALVSDLQAQNPDHIAVTGDLVNLSLELEIAPARDWLKGVGPADRVTIIPGNHDAYVPRALDRFNAAFADYIAGETARPGHPYPFLRRIADVAIVAVSTAVPTPPMMATGWLGPAQRVDFEAMLGRLADENLFRVVLIHHPLRAKDRYKRLVDAKEIEAILLRRGADLVLHGHDHIHDLHYVRGPKGDIPVLSVPAASAAFGLKRPPGAYNLLAIERGEDGWRCTCTTRGYDAQGELRELNRVRLI